MDSQSFSNSAPRPRPFQFNLQQLLSAVSVVSLFCAAFVWMGVCGLLYACLVATCIFCIPSLWKRSLLAFAVIFAGTAVPPSILYLGLVVPHLKQMGCRSNLKLIGVALDGYHETHGCFPPAYFTDANGKPVHSWRLLVRPYFEGEPIYDLYDLREPWNGPKNGLLTRFAVPEYHCPSESGARRNHATSYLALVGPGTAFRGGNSTSQKDLGDRASITILVIESPGADIPWMEPRDLTAVDLLGKIDSGAMQGRHAHLGGVQVLMADYEVRFLTYERLREIVQAMLAATQQTEDGDSEKEDNP